VANSQAAAADERSIVLGGSWPAVIQPRPRRRRAPLHHRHQDLADEQHQRARRAAHQDHPDAIRPDLASSLNNLSASLADLGRRPEW